ncbi:cytochrome P450 3A6-like isoform X2 [Centruroides sculpturatus]|uniref:cytochrome P450 3A6-like isoform X2 n=1 Tax=Centruroides sculpturatus TaxID=218467 RepID=UPI000C6E5657|nr:cytochrome P450 3A6-like isoform X2 [Centruroides sculpturatus]
MICNRRENFRCFEKLGIPGPEPSFWFGNLLDAIKLGRQSEVLLQQKYGPIYGVFLGSVPFLIVADPELLKIIQVKKAQIFNKRNPIVPGVGIPVKLVTESVVFMIGSKWKHNRDAVTPSYTTSKLKMLAAVVNRSFDKSWKDMREMTKNGVKFDMREFLSSSVADMTFQSAFGIVVNDQKKLVQSLNYSFDTDFTNPINFLSVCFPEISNFLHLLRNFTHKIRHFFSFSSTLFVLEMCKKVISTRLSLEKNSYPDVLQLLINASSLKNVELSEENEKSEKVVVHSEYKLSYKDCLSNCFYTAVAKFDTIRSAVTFSTYCIAKYPEVQDKIREEISKYNKKEESIDYTAISKMTYLDQVLSEVLRLFPPAASFVNRIAEEDLKYNDILIPKGMTVYAPLYGLHRNPAYWSDPDEFKPERFQDKSSINPYIYQPFGIGLRHCAGMRPAQLICKLLLANLVKNFKFSLAPETKEIEPHFTLVITFSKHPIYLNATPL